MTCFRVFQKITVYKSICDVTADTKEEAMAKAQTLYPYRFSNILNKYGCQKDETGDLAEINELVARKNPWYSNNGFD